MRKSIKIVRRFVLGQLMNIKVEHPGRDGLKISFVSVRPHRRARGTLTWRWLGPKGGEKL